MVDFKIKDGDTVVDSSGQYTKLFGKEAEFQRVIICISALFGKFIYNRELGSLRSCLDSLDENYLCKLELVLNEALADFENVYVNVLEYGSKLKVKITIDDETRIEEILLNG
jgi:hypothetical protein